MTEQEHFQQLEKMINSNQSVRDKLLEKVIETVTDMDLDPNSSAKVIEARCGIIDLVDKLLKSKEDVSMKQIKLLLSQKSVDAETENGAMVVELLKRIGQSVPEDDTGQTGGTMIVGDNDEEFDISPGELTMCETGGELEFESE